MEQDTGAPTPEATPSDEPEGEPLFVARTQKDLDKRFGEEKRQASAARDRAIMEKFGVDSLDDLNEIVETYRMIESETETEADKARQKAEKLEKKAQEAESRYTSTLKEYALRDAFRDAGINSERLPLALKVADMDALDLDGNSVTGLEDVVSAVQEASPEWFGTQERAPRRSPDATRQTTPESNTYEGQVGGFLADLLSRP